MHGWIRLPVLITLGLAGLRYREATGLNRENPERVAPPSNFI